MEIVLGVSTTPTMVRMVLVEGESADGVIVDHDVFDVTTTDGVANSSASKQVIDAVLGTQEGAVARGYHLLATGVTSSDQAESSALREALSISGINGVMLFSELHAAGALAQTIGRTVGYDTTALMFIERDTATLSVVRTVDCATAYAVTRSLNGADAIAVLTEMVTGLKTHEPQPNGIFVVGSGGVDVTSVKVHLENVISMPVRAPDEPELALARAAALAAASAPCIDVSTVGLAYSQEPDGGTTEADVIDAVMPGPDGGPEGRRPFLLAGSALTAIFGVGVVALVVSLAVNIQPAADQRAAPGESVMHPNALAPAPPKVQNAQPNYSGPEPQIVPTPGPPAGAPPTPESAPPAATLQEIPPAPTHLAQTPAPVGPPVAPAAPVGTPPAILPAPVIQLPVPGLPPILMTPTYGPPAVRPPWYPVPQQPQWRQPWHGRHGGERGGD